MGGDWSGTVSGGYDRQSRQDFNGDGWADLAGYRRWTVRPRLFWKGASGAKVYLTAGAMTEQREGGTLPGRTAPDGQPFVQRSEEHTSELQSLMRISYAVFCLKKKKHNDKVNTQQTSKKTEYRQQQQTNSITIRQ